MVGAAWSRGVRRVAVRCPGHPRGPLPGPRSDFHLARELGMTVADLRRRMSVREYVEWCALANVEARERAMAQARAGGRR